GCDAWSRQRTDAAIPLHVPLRRAPEHDVQERDRPHRHRRAGRNVQVRRSALREAPAHLHPAREHAMTRIRSFALPVAFAALAASCNNPPQPMPSGGIQTHGSALINDQANGGGKVGFAWIPPMVTSAPAFTTLDQTGGSNNLTIKVDRLFPDNTTAAK